MSKKEWVTWKIPQGSDIHKFVENNPNTTPWKILTNLLEQQPKPKEDQAIEVFEKFIKDINDIYPGCIDKLQMLRPLILKKLLKNEVLEDDYFNDLKEL